MTRIPPAVLGGAAALAQLALSRRRPVDPVSGLVAAPVAAGSVWMLAGSVGEFVRHRTTVDPVTLDHPQALVTTGPNALTRNPMYVGLTGLLLAHAIARHSAAALAPAAVFAYLLDRTQIPAEERALASTFPDGYASYAAQVPRWLTIRTSPRGAGREPHGRR